MGLGLLPWEKWLPRWLYGPALCAISVFGVIAGHDQLSLFEWIACAFVFIGGVLLTYAWFVDRRNGIG